MTTAILTISAIVAAVWLAYALGKKGEKHAQEEEKADRLRDQRDAAMRPAADPADVLERMRNGEL